ncbi:MAG: PAS domain-containing protein, partial [Anaerolineae bacterium]|nr:PAS domain-containing protein [Anaerolineae bacterium]
LRSEFVLDEKGKIIRSFGTEQDITARKQAQRALQESEERFKQLAEAVEDVFVISDIESDSILYANPAYEQLWGRPVHDLYEDYGNWSAGIHPDDRKGMLDGWKGMRNNHHPYDGHYRVVRPDGTIRMVKSRVYPIHDEKGQIYRAAEIVQDITEGLEQEKALRESEERFKQLADTIDDAFIITDVLNQDILYASPAFETIWGISLPELYKDREHLEKGVHPEDLPRIQESWRHMKEGRGNYDEQYRVIHADGSVRWVQSRAYPIYDQNGQIYRTAGIIHDITERVEAEQALRKSESNLRATLDSIGDAVISTNTQGTIVNMNPVAEKLTGWKLVEAQGKPLKKIFNIINNKTKEKASDPVAKVIESGQIVGLANDTLLTAKDGAEYMIAESAAPIQGLEGVTTGVVLVFRDVTEEYHLRDNLQESEARFKQLAEAIDDVFVIFDVNTEETLYVNSAFEQIWGHPVQKLYENNVELWREAIHPEDLPMVDKALAGILEHGDRQAEEEYRVIRPDGSERWVRDRSYPIYDENGQVYRIAGIIQDITERVEQEEELRESEQKYRNLVETSQDLIWKLDQDGLFTYINPAWGRLLGYQANEMLGHTFAEFKPPEIAARDSQSFQTAMKGKETFGYETVYLTKSGEKKNLVFNSKIMHDTTGNIIGTQGTAHDITARVQAEEALRNSEERFKQLAEVSDEVFVISNLHLKSGSVLYANPAYEHIWGRPVHELYGDVEQLFEGIHPDDRQSIRASWERFLEKKDYFEEKYRVIRPDGSMRWVRDRGYPVRDGSGEVYRTAEIIQDITDQVNAQSEIQTHVSELEILYENGLVIAGLHDPQKIARRIIEVLEQKLDWHHVGIRLYHKETDSQELMALSHPGLDNRQTQKEIKRINKVISNTNQGFSGWVIKHGKPVRSGNLIEDPRYNETYPDLNSGLYVPFLIGDKVIGSITVESEKEDAFTIQDERFLITLANQAAVSFENAQLYHQLQQELNERARTEDEIRKLNTELEQRVAERTSEIKAAHQRMELAASAAGIGVWERKAGSDEQYWDERMHHIYGTSPDKFTPTISEWKKFVYPEDQQILEDKVAQAIEHKLPYEHEYRIVTADGSLRHISSHAIVLYNEQNKFTEMIGVNVDVTTLKRAEDTLRLANTELERALRVKDEFLTNMSHELRTPLNAILGLSESLGEQIAGPLNEKQLRYIQTISESGHHLLELINDILDLARIEAEQIVPEVNKVDIHQVCKTSTRMIKQMAHNKGQEVTIKIDDKIELIWADERRLKQMIVNLLSNAVKFTPQGGKLGIKVDVEQATNNILITVWDNGIGISNKDQKRLFKPFVQLDSSLSRESTGSGLGLALVSQMARLYGGRLAVDSAPDKGSRFTITLPWKPAQQSSPKATVKTKEVPTAPVQSDRNGQTILIVEDTDEIVMMIKDYLELIGYHIFVAKNGVDGIKKTRQIHPDLILMDVMMSGMDGLEATRKIRSEAAIADIPIIGMTALAMPEDRDRCLAAGMNDYLSKPINLNKLASIIDGYLSEDEA